MVDIINQSEVYSGCYGRVNFNVYPYNAAGKKGVGFGLCAVQKLRDGEPLSSGRVSAEDAFGVSAQNIDHNGYSVPQAGTAQMGSAPAAINPATGMPF